MNLQEFFAISGSSYEEIHNRISSDILLKKFLRQFLEDKTFANLVEAVDKKDYKNGNYSPQKIYKKSTLPTV